MRIRVNGKEMDIEKEITLSDLLERLDIVPKGIAVEVNREIVPKSLYRERLIKEGDRIEIVRMVGGG